MKLIKIITDDLSPSLFHPELNEHYHSVNGALQESMHVFINAGLKEINKDKINILDVGFGTGLNALLSFYESENRNKQIYYETIEKFPLPENIIQELYNEQLYHDDVFLKLHRSWEKNQKISESFMLKKMQIDLLDYQPKQNFDLIYFDAFAPDKQPELWTEDIFTKLYEATKENGILVTYSSKGIVKQALRKAGYFVKRLPGPKGKRHMVRAIKV